MKRSRILACLSIAGAVALASPVAALAQGKGKAAAKAKAEEPKKVKSYDFTGDEIDGELVKPDGDFLDTRKFASHTSLIRLRKDFIKEIVKSAEDL
ncbi:MAG TPA: hypothetical protein VEL05_11770 [Candidatus Acidoferrum sp.]|nr:hypothetical protein [Candidatus Acidoferrum sp.]